MMFVIKWTLSQRFITALFTLVLNFAVYAKSPASDYLPISQQQLAYLELEQGSVVLLLAEPFAPKTVARFRDLVKQNYYDGMPFYRVIDQFVLQAGQPDNETMLGKQRPLTGVSAEFSWPVRAVDPYVLLQQPDLLAEQTGYNQGFAVGREHSNSGQTATEWLLHCPNVVNLARDSDKDSGRSDFAIMQGQAPRHLDRNMAIFARVIWGSEHLNAIIRGGRQSGGLLTATEPRSRIIRLRLGVDVPKAEQLSLEIENPQSAAFIAAIQRRRSKADDFYQHKGNGQLDICYLPLQVRVKLTP